MTPDGLAASAPSTPPEQTCDRDRDGGEDEPVPRSGRLRHDPHRLGLGLVIVALGRLVHADTLSRQGDALYDLAVLTLGHEEHLDDVVAGYRTDVDLDVIRGWWSCRSLVAIRWLVEHGFDPAAPGGEVDVLKARM